MDNLFSSPWFRLDQLSGFSCAAIALFSLLIIVYSCGFMKGRPFPLLYYVLIILTTLASVGAVLANNLILLLVFWGFLGLTLYLLINMGDAGSPAAAKKAMIIVGGSDAVMLLGLGIIYYFTKSMRMDAMRLEFNNWLLVAAYLCIAIGCFAKAGAMPLHSWIPDCAKSAPIPVTAFLPASLDKILGIYLLVRISLNLFVMNEAMNTFLMFIGAFTIIAAVMMALVQHNMKKLMGYHAVSQVGYMVLGIGTGNAVGIAGGIFHMLNNAVYKSCLFLSAGNVEYRAKTAELGELGGLAKLMPITYISCMIASFSISGVPPFNGFVSKWLIYQGLILRIADIRSPLQLIFSVFCLIAAMFGSILTMASFIKLLHAVFLGQRLDSTKNKDIKEVPWTMYLPPVLLAGICIIFGVFAFSLPLKYLIFPAVAAYLPVNPALLLGVWSPTLVTLLIILSLALGLLIFELSPLKSSLRRDTAFVGGENSFLKEENAVTGTEFYNTIIDISLLKGIYRKAGKGNFDIYEQGKRIFSVSKFLQYLHNGVLPTYLVWILLGMVGLFLVLLR